AASSRSPRHTSHWRRKDSVRRTTAPASVPGLRLPDRLATVPLPKALWLLRAEHSSCRENQTRLGIGADRSRHLAEFHAALLARRHRGRRPSAASNSWLRESGVLHS